jgi:ribosome-associated toxin RatA of RatAB toxin-antitoxin module
MFDLIERAEHYPLFLPWCADSTILSRDDDIVSARIGVDYHGVRFHFTTRNPKRRPEFLAVRFTEGPFRRFEGEWHLKPLAIDACRIDFILVYEFDTGLVARLAGPVFERIANTMVNAFVARAEEVHRNTADRARPSENL